MELTISGVGVLDKSVALLRAVEAADGPCALQDLVAATGFTKPTAHRLAAALEAHGLLGRDGDGRYLLGLGLVALGHQAAESWPLGEVARPYLEDLREATGESVQLYVRQGDQRVCLLSLESAHELRTIVAEGSRLALEVGSAGRILLGQALEEPWTASVEERAAGVASVSAPVVVGGEVVAAIGISGPLGRLGADPGPRFGPAVAQAAASISAARWSTG
jgi:DNA-binding IclR family transcriptional regulator